jgi:VanZ family protein
MARLPRQPKFWLCCFIFWIISLWVLSSFAGPSEGEPPIVNIDKLAHFGYFFGGSGLLSAYLFRRRSGEVNWRKNFIVVVVVLGLIGAQDEFHQSFVHGRSGNDPYDWLADVLGAMAGAFVFKKLHSLLK